MGTNNIQDVCLIVPYVGGRYHGRCCSSSSGSALLWCRRWCSWCYTARIPGWCTAWLLVGVTMAAAAPAPQDQRFFGVGGGVPGVIQPGFLGGVQPGFGNPGFANPNFQQIQLNAAGQPCEKFSRNAFGQYVCTETLEQIAPGAFNPSTSGVGQFGGQFGGNPFLQG